MKTCGKGHEYTTLSCGACVSLQSARYYVANKEKRKAQGKIWREENKKKSAEYSKTNYETNREKRKAQCKANRDANKEKLAARRKEYLAANPEMQHAINAKRRAAKLQQTPPWYNHTDCKAIYKELKPGYNVDHIIPLQGENVSGLHWHHNLQLLPAAENMAKSNKFDPDTYVHELPFY